MKPRFFLLLLLSLPSLLCAQQLESFKGAIDNGYNFYVYTPPQLSAADSVAADSSIIAQDSVKPLVLFLHGASLCGSDLQRVRRYGVLHAIQMGLDLDAYVLAPQNPGGAWKPLNINNCVDYAVSHYPIDTTRIYVIGMSLGGFGTIDYLAVYHSRIAAAMAICGGGNPKDYCGLNDVPLWIVHGNADRQVSINASRKVINAMKKCDESLPRLLFSELEGVNHTFPARLFYLESTYRWLFEHRRDDSTRLPNQDYAISTSDMRNAYHMLRKRHAPLNVVAKVGSDKESKSTTSKSKSSATTSKSTNASSNASTSSVYRVKKGDTLEKIARRNGTTVAKLCQLNGIKATSTLQIGQKIKLR